MGNPSYARMHVRACAGVRVYARMRACALLSCVRALLSRTYAGVKHLIRACVRALRRDISLYEKIRRGEGM